MQKSGQSRNSGYNWKVQILRGPSSGGAIFHLLNSPYSPSAHDLAACCRGPRVRLVLATQQKVAVMWISGNKPSPLQETRGLLSSEPWSTTVSSVNPQSYLTWVLDKRYRVGIFC